MSRKLAWAALAVLGLAISACNRTPPASTPVAGQPGVVGQPGVIGESGATNQNKPNPP